MNIYKNNINNNGEFLYIAHIQFSFIYHFLLHTAAISALGTHCHLCLTKYSFTPESSEACKDKVPCPCPRTQHRNNVSILRGEKHYISLKILHQAGFETARQAVTLAKLRTVAIAPHPSGTYCTTNTLCYYHWQCQKCTTTKKL